MQEYVRQGRRYVVVKGQNIPFDGKITVYIDSESGTWVVESPFDLESITDVLQDALAHFEDLLGKEQEGRVSELLGEPHGVLMPVIPELH